MDILNNQKLLKNISYAALAGLLVLTFMHKCSNTAHKPNERQIEDIFSWSLPTISAVSKGGEDKRLTDAGAKLVRGECWSYEPSSISERRHPKPKYDCVFWFTGSDGISYVAALLVEYIPESSVYVDPDGRRLDFANVGRYQIASPNAAGREEILRKHASDFF